MENKQNYRASSIVEIDNHYTTNRKLDRIKEDNDKLIKLLERIVDSIDRIEDILYELKYYNIDNRR